MMSWCFFDHKGEAKINTVLDKVTKNKEFVVPFT